jgi:hypothetical protein
MKEMKYIPKGKHAEVWEGSVLIKLPRYRERLKLVRDAGFKPSGDGTMSADSDGLAMMDKLLEATEKNIVKMELIHKESGEKFESMEDLECYAEGVELLSDIGNVLLSGLRLGEI